MMTGTDIATSKTASSLCTDILQHVLLAAAAASAAAILHCRHYSSIHRLSLSLRRQAFRLFHRKQQHQQRNRQIMTRLVRRMTDATGFESFRISALPLLKKHLPPLILRRRRRFQCWDLHTKILNIPPLLMLLPPSLPQPATYSYINTIKELLYIRPLL